jgi:predicted DCC family thiol-disulfide oxidoreductase YuxK
MKQPQVGHKIGKAALIFDKNCPLCSNTVKWIGEHEAPDAFEMVPCQSKATVARFPEIEQAACMNAMHLILPDGRVMVGEKALPEIVLRLRRYHFVAALFKLPGTLALSRTAYRWFAKHRYWIAGILGHVTERKKHLT